MKAILLTIMACLVASCVSSTREREAYGLGVLTVDVWQADDEFKSAERAWRTAQQTRVELLSRDQYFSVRTLLVNQVPPPSITPASDPARVDKSSNRMPEIDEERALYRHVTAAHARQKDTAEWYSRVARRVQTRVEEDEMLIPVLGMLATSTAIVFYPIIRWNVRSVLWEGVDPDAADDPVQVFCATRLERENPGLRP